MHNIIDKSQLMYVQTQNHHGALSYVCPELQPWAWPNQTGTPAWEFGHVHVGMCLTKYGRDIMKCKIMMLYRTCVSEILCPHVCCWAEEGAASRGAGGQDLQSYLMLTSEFATCMRKKNPSCCLLFCSGAVCDSPAAFGTSKSPTWVDMEGSQ